MDTNNKILLAEMLELWPKHAELANGVSEYIGICQKLDDSSKKYESAVQELKSIADGNGSSTVESAAKNVRFRLREHGLLLSQAARQLSKMSANSLELSENMASIIANDGGKRI